MGANEVASAEAGALEAIKLEDLSAGQEEVEAKVALGYAYDPLHVSSFNECAFEIDLPDTLWTHASLALLFNGGNKPLVNAFLPSACFNEARALYALTVVLTLGIGFGQLYIALSIYIQVNNEGNEQCAEGTLWMRMLTMLVFTLVMSGNFHSSYQILRYAYEIPPWEDYMQQLLELVDGPSRLLFRARTDSSFGAVRQIVAPATGISRWIRLYIYACVAFKVTTEIAVTIAGMGLIARSTSDLELVSNSVAVAFVADIDDIAESALMSAAARRQLRRTFPPIALQMGSTETFTPGMMRLFDWVGAYSPSFQPFVLALSVAFFYRVWCGLEASDESGLE